MQPDDEIKDKSQTGLSTEATLVLAVVVFLVIAVLVRIIFFMAEDAPVEKAARNDVVSYVQDQMDEAYAQNTRDAVKGMTWTLLKKDDRDISIVLMGCNNGNPGGCNAYHGDRTCEEHLPVLCLRKTTEVAPGHLQTDFYTTWSQAETKLSSYTKGNHLTSREAADNICRKEFGNDWRMAEFHDGQGWGFWARAATAIPAQQHFWVAINDQQANCWDRDRPPVQANPLE